MTSRSNSIDVQASAQGKRAVVSRNIHIVYSLIAHSRGRVHKKGKSYQEQARELGLDGDLTWYAYGGPQLSLLCGEWSFFSVRARALGWSWGYAHTAVALCSIRDEAARDAVLRIAGPKACLLAQGLARGQSA